MTDHNFRESLPAKGRAEVVATLIIACDRPKFATLAVRDQYTHLVAALAEKNTDFRHLTVVASQPRYGAIVVSGPGNDVAKLADVAEELTRAKFGEIFRVVVEDASEPAYLGAVPRTDSLTSFYAPMLR